MPRLIEKLRPTYPRSRGVAGAEVGARKEDTGETTSAGVANADTDVTGGGQDQGQETPTERGDTDPVVKTMTVDTVTATKTKTASADTETDTDTGQRQGLASTRDTGLVRPITGATETVRGGEDTIERLYTHLLSRERTSLP